MENKTNRRRIRKENSLIEKEIAELKKHNCGDYIIQHALLVMRISEKIVQKLQVKDVSIDKMVVLRGALLHDIGRSVEHSVRHGYLGGEILREDGYDDRIIRVVENHVGGGIDKEESKKLWIPEKDFIPTALEEKIVCLADKYIEDNKLTPLEQTLKKFETVLGKRNMASKRILKIKKEIEFLTKEKIEATIKL